MISVGIIVCLLHTLILSDAAFTWIRSDASVDFIQGQAAKLVWTVDIGNGKPWDSVKITRRKSLADIAKNVVIIVHSQQPTKHLSGRDADIDLVVQETLNVVNVTFTLRNLTKTDEMSYTVLVSDKNRYTEERTTSLTVLVLPGTPVLQLHPDKPVFCRGDTINITCNGVTVNPSLTTLTFLRNDSTIGMLNVTTSGNYTKAVLSHALTQPGTLTFSCNATNAAGSSPTSNVVIITVKDHPVITSCTNKTAVEKDNLVWSCDVNGSQPLNISWFKGNTSTVFQSGKSLSIAAVNRTDSGMYRFTASNGGECPTASTTVYLHVQYSPTCIYNTFEATNRQCVSMQRDGNPLSTLSCCPPENINISQIGNNYTMCGVKSNSISICTMANAIGKCSFILKVYQQVTEYLYKGSFRITNRLYQDSLNDRSSVEFKTLKANIENMLKSVYTPYKYVTSAEVMEFWPGSVIVAFQLKLVANIKDPLLPMKEALIKNGSSLGGFKIDPNSIQSGEYVPPTTMGTTKATTLQSSPSSQSSSSSQSSPTPCIYTESSQVPAIVLGVLFAIALVIIIILVGYIIWKYRIENKARPKSSSNNNQEAVYMNEIALQDQVPSNVAQYESVNNQEQQQPTTQLYQSLQTQTPSETYSSLSPNTKLPPKPAVITNSGVYQDIQGASRPQYQSLDNFSRV